MVFVMLNPSTADETQDDATIRRCISFARREGCGRLLVCNLFAYRATDPRELARVPDPVGPDNARHVRRAMDDADVVVAAWGAHPAARTAAVLGILRGRRLHALGVTREGAPRHPLYVRADARLVPFKVTP